MNAFKPENRPAYLRISARKAWEGPAGDLRCSTLIHAIRAQEAMFEGWNSIDSIARAKDPRMTSTGHLEKINQLSKKLMDKSLKEIHQVTDSLRLRQKEIKKEIADKLQLAERPTTAELRGIIRNMTDSQKREAIMSAIEERDSEVLTAFFLTHPIAVGLKKSEQQAYRDLAEKKMAPKLMEYHDHLEGVKNVMFGLLDDNLEVYQKSNLSEAEKAAIAVSEQATAAFNSAMAPVKEEVPHEVV